MDGTQTSTKTSQKKRKYSNKSKEKEVLVFSKTNKSLINQEFYKKMLLELLKKEAKQG